MDSPLSVNNGGEEVVSEDDGHGVHLIYSEYDSAPSETNVEVIEGPQHYWWTSSKSPVDETGRYYNHAPHGTNDYCSPQNGREVCLIYSDYDEPSSETSVNMDNFFYNNNISGREVQLIYSEYGEPPSETDVEYDGRPWCSIFGNPALWKIRDEGREVHLIYSDYPESESEAAVEIEEPQIVKISKEWEVDAAFEDSEYLLGTARCIDVESDESVNLETDKSFCVGSNEWILETGKSVDVESNASSFLESDYLNEGAILETCKSASVNSKEWVLEKVNIANDESNECVALETSKSVSFECNLSTAKYVSDTEVKTGKELSYSSDETSNTDTNIISSDIYTKRPQKLRIAAHIIDSFELIEQKLDESKVEVSEMLNGGLQPVPLTDLGPASEGKAAVAIRDLENIDQLLSFTNTGPEDSVFEDPKSKELDTAKGSISSNDSIHTGFSIETTLQEEMNTLDVPSNFVSLESI